eukprot:gnl/MRDRNA2_/MRDRNA2_118517_c0_seq1.p1 gnl/MRDRNA2_/MRDRNA2_118517_c0~~gnl/MRDRNA2_/MRDRNA2_118517_c0_seq1.p1  ORF type:complete len:808 (-),score=156.28 gnl/MRDRNA2_/MRDRNA2_118517_c0_seq1:3-2426(-)
MEFLKLENTVFQQGPQFELESGTMTIQEAMDKVLKYYPEAIACCCQDINDEPNYECTIVRMGTSKFVIDEEGLFVSYVYKKKLPAASFCYCDDFSDTDHDGVDESRAMGWQRPGRGEGLADELPSLTLFSGIDPNDLYQGDLGDCWLVAAFAALAEFPDSISNVFKERDISANGSYTIRLYSYELGDWKDVQIDDRLPCSYGNAAYVKITYDGEIWPCLLEKAFAKYCGGYNELIGGTSAFAFGAMTGCTDLIDISKNAAGKWTVAQPIWVTDKVSELNENKILDDSVNDMDFLEMLAEFDENDFVMAASVAKSGVDFGLVEDHCYSLISVKKNVCGKGFNLIQLRNSWGAGEWEGDWGDSSNLWDKHPDVKLECGKVDADDGLFWIGHQDFCAHFQNAMICKITLGKSRSKAAAEYQKDQFAQGKDALAKSSPGLVKSREDGVATSAVTQCVECGSKFGEGNSTFYQHEDGALCATCMDKRRLKCEACGEHILEGKAVAVDGKNYHKDCFACLTCKQPITGRYAKIKLAASSQFGGYICNVCADDQRPKCCVCKESISSGGIKVNGATYHASCFTCSTCQVPINGRYVQLGDAGQATSGGHATFQCMGCAESKLPKGAVPASEPVKNCSGCGKEFGPGVSYYMHGEGKTYCGECNDANKPICAGCQQPISGAILTAAGNKYHPPCFACGVCRASITGPCSFTEDKIILCGVCTKAQSDPKAMDKSAKLASKFQLLDADGNGEISCDELQSVLLKIGVGEADIPAIFEGADVNGDGKIDYTEFCNWICGAAPQSVKTLWELPAVFTS